MVAAADDNANTAHYCTSAAHFNVAEVMRVNRKLRLWSAEIIKLKVKVKVSV